MVKKKFRPPFLDELIKNRGESRYAKLLYVAVALLALLGARLFYMQIVEGADYKEQADGNRIRQVSVQAARGVMYDRNGVILAGSRPAYSVVIAAENRKQVLQGEELQRLSGMLKITPADLEAKIKKQGNAFGPVYLANDVGLDVVTQIEERKSEFPGIEIEMQPVRVYPFQEAGAQVLGYVGDAGPDDKMPDGRAYPSGTLIGRAGLEREYNEYLMGQNGSRRAEVDATGQIVRYFNDVPAAAGHNIRLTLDARLQEATEKAIIEQIQILNRSHMYPTGVSAVAIDPNSGAVLAMVNWPSFNPNEFSRGITASEWNSIIQNPNHPMQDRAISAMYPPGSTFKVVTGAAGLENKVITPEEQIFDNGRHWLIDKRNAGGEAFGWINFYGAVAKSDNVYFYEVGRRLGIDKISAMARSFGLGQKTGIDLEGESEGNVASEEYKRKVFNQDWYLGRDI
jgi:penicillin-binding protein 2